MIEFPAVRVTVQDWIRQEMAAEWMAHLWDNVALYAALDRSVEFRAWQAWRTGVGWMHPLWDNVALWVCLDAINTEQIDAGGSMERWLGRLGKHGRGGECVYCPACGTNRAWWHVHP